MRKILQIIGNAASNADLLNDNCIGHSHSVVTSSIVSNTSHFSDPQKLLQTLLGSSSAAQLYLAKHTWLCFHSKRSKPGGHTFPVAPQPKNASLSYFLDGFYFYGRDQCGSIPQLLFNATLICGLNTTFQNNFCYARYARLFLIIRLQNYRFLEILDVEKSLKMSRILRA